MDLYTRTTIYCVLLFLAELKTVATQTVPVDVNIKRTEGFVVDGGNMSWTCVVGDPKSDLALLMLFRNDTGSSDVIVYTYSYILNDGEPGDDYVSRTLDVHTDGPNVTVVVMDADITDDDGFYYCFVEPKFGRGLEDGYSQDLEVAVYVPTDDYNLTAVNEGDNIWNLICRVGPGRPPPEISWTYEGDDGTETNTSYCDHPEYCVTEGKLTLDTTDRADQKITCTVSQGEPFNWQDNEEYTFPPAVPAQLELLESVLVSGGNISLTCQSSETDLRHIEWFIEDQTDAIYKYQFGSGGEGFGDYVDRTLSEAEEGSVTLIIMEAKFPQDNTTFRCYVLPLPSAGLMGGWSEWVEADVYVRAHDYSLTPTDEGTIMLSLTCTAGPGRPPPEISWAYEGDGSEEETPPTCDPVQLDYCVTERKLTLDTTDRAGEVVTCTVSQGEPFNWHDNLTYTIEGEDREPSTPEPTPPPQEPEEVPVGDNATLLFTHSITDPEEVWWLKDNVSDPRVAEFNVTTSECMADDERITCAPILTRASSGHSLTIENTTFEDAGNYTLHVRRVDGEVIDFGPVYLRIVEPAVTDGTPLDTDCSNCFCKVECAVPVGVALFIVLVVITIVLVWAFGCLFIQSPNPCTWKWNKCTCDPKCCASGKVSPTDGSTEMARKDEPASPVQSNPAPYAYGNTVYSGENGIPEPDYPTDDTPNNTEERGATPPVISIPGVNSFENRTAHL